MDRGLKDSYANWIAHTFEERDALAFTLNFRQRCNGDWLTHRVAADTMQRYYRGLCRKAFGCRQASRMEQPERLKFVAVKEGQLTRHLADTQLHYHGIVEVPSEVTLREWQDVCEEQWRKLVWADQNSYEFVTYESAGYVKYILKNRTKDDWQEAIDFKTMELAPANDSYDQLPTLLFENL